MKIKVLSKSFYSNLKIFVATMGKCYRIFYTYKLQWHFHIQFIHQKLIQPTVTLLDSKINYLAILVNHKTW